MIRTIALDAAFLLVLAIVAGIATVASGFHYAAVISSTVALDFRMFPTMAALWVACVFALWAVERARRTALVPFATAAVAIASAPMLGVAYFKFTMYAYFTAKVSVSLVGSIVVFALVSAALFYVVRRTSHVMVLNGVCLAAAIPVAIQYAEISQY